MRLKTSRDFLVFLLILTLSGLVTETSAAADLPLTVVPQGELAQIGQDLVLHIDVGLPAGQSLTAGQFQVQVTADDGASPLDEPYPLRVISDPVAGSSPAAYAGQVKLEWVATVLSDAVPTERTLAIKVQAGENSGTARTTVKVDFGKEWDADKITSFIERRGMFLFLLLIFGFGLLMSLSPCIYPMIPITLAVIGAQRKEGTGVVQGLGMSLTYAIGMALIYAIIGYVSATIFSGIIAFLQSAVVMVPIALLLIVLSFSMFGAYTLQAPAWLQNRLGGPGGGRSGLVGVFLMGMVAGLIASPCVGPFLGGLLLALSTTGNPLLAFIALFIFGMGMSVLLIAVGTFPALLGSLPQSGGWMETVNRGMGLLLVAMAFYFLRPGSVLPETVFWPLVGTVTVIVAVFMGAFDRQDGAVTWWDRTRKGLGLVTFLAGLYFLAGSFLSHGFIMNSPLGMGSHQTGTTVLAQEGPSAGQPVEVKTVSKTADKPAVIPAKVPWTVVHTGENVQSFLDEARAKAKAEGKPVMIDFWATWCVYCKKLDKHVWNVPEVVEESLRFVTIKVDATAPDDAEMTAIKEEFKVPGLPRVIFIDSRGKVLHGRTSAFKPAAEMLEVMRGVR